MKNITMKVIIALWISLVASFSYAQPKLPDIVPASPQSRAFQIYGEYPVSYNTGIPDISIPLYNIKCGELELPITLRYYGSGVKPHDPDMSNIGTGWTLDVGGLISRTIEGRADELFRKPSPFLSASQIDQDNYDHILYLNSIVSNRDKDGQFDRFSYSFPGKNGSFAIEDDGSGNFTAYTYPFVPYKINVTTTSPTNPQYYRSISGIDVTDDKGILYQFGHNNVEKAIVDADAAPTGWYLEKITNASGSDEISIQYDAIPNYQWVSTNGSIDIRSNESGDNGVALNDACSVGALTAYGYCDIQGNSIYYETKNIKKILFTNGYVELNLSIDKKFIESIVIYNKNDEIIKTINFVRDNFPGSSIFKRLKSFTVTGKYIDIEQKYEFTYNEIHPVADNRCLTDQWGYCRGEATNTNLCMQRDVQVKTHENGTSPPVVQTITVGTDNLTPNEEYMKRYILEKIKYPTGGTTEFIYEAKEYMEGSTVKTGGGLRIKKIISSNGTSIPFTKSYEYEPGVIEHSMDNAANFTTCRFTIVEQCLATGTTPLFYAFRNRTLANGWNANLGSNAVSYRKVTEYVGTTTDNIGKTIYTYSYDNSDETSPTTIGSGKRGIYVPSYYIKKYRNWGNGLLTKKEIFKNVGSNNYTLIEDASYSYQFNDIKTLSGLYVFQVASYSGYANSPLGAYSARNDMSTISIYSKNDFLLGSSVNDQSIVTGAYFIKSSTENKYDGASTSTVNYEYEYANANHYYPTKIIKTLSSGEKDVKNLSYVDEFSSASPYSVMKGLNIVSPLIETKEYIRNTSDIDRLIKTEKINYNNWGANILKPVNIQSSVLAATAETRIAFNQYDINGNILEQQKANDTKHSYVWDYNNSYPIAEVTNASYSDIAYTSFEADGKGNWTFSGSPVPDVTAPTGKRVYDLSSGSITKSINSATTYIISYWRPESLSSLTITGTISGYPISGRTVNGWKYYEHKISAQSNATISGSGNVDELRLYPASALMTTYTYEPLVGMTSQCDAGNRITYYEYDGFGRLALVRDQDKNIIKKICYNYAGQPEDCQTYYYNGEKSASFSRNNCTAGYTSSPVIYTVAASKYKSTISQEAADQLALNDIDANGQAYANTNGTCQRTPIAVTLKNSGEQGQQTFYVKFTANGSSSHFGFINKTLASGASFTNDVYWGTYDVEIEVKYGDMLKFSLNGQVKTGSLVTYTNVSITDAMTIYAGAYQNTTQNVNYTRNNCPPNNTPSTVVYVVAPNIYTSFISQADANTQAISQTASAGQAYANANGTCLPPIPPTTDIVYTNQMPKTITLKLTNTLTGILYTFSLPKKTTPTTAGTIPTGVYNVTMKVTGESEYYSINSYVQAIPDTDFSATNVLLNTAITTVTAY